MSRVPAVLGSYVTERVGIIIFCISRRTPAVLHITRVTVRDLNRPRAHVYIVRVTLHTYYYFGRKNRFDSNNSIRIKYHHIQVQAIDATIT